MANPWGVYTPGLSGPTPDIEPVTPNDSADLANAAVALYVETGGTLAIVTAAGIARSVTVPDYTILPVGVVRVKAAGTTATGIHAFTIAG